MARNYQHGNAHMSHAKTTAHALIAIGTVLVLAVASGFAFSFHERSLDKASNQVPRPTSSPTNNQQTEITNETSQSANQEKVEPMQQPTSGQTTNGATNTSNSSTTVTVNGETTSVKGNGSVKKSYISEDGKSKVNVSIKHSSD